MPIGGIQRILVAWELLALTRRDKMNLPKRDLFILWGLSTFWLAVYLASMLYHTGGRWGLPLDDSFIYFQYARQVADGHFLQYNTGASPTAGATSLLYMLLLVPGFLLGLEGMEIAGYALVLGLLLLIMTAKLRIKPI